MITFIKAKRKKSDDQTDFDKYKMSAHEILQNIISEQNRVATLCLSVSGIIILS